MLLILWCITTTTIIMDRWMDYITAWREGAQVLKHTYIYTHLSVSPELFIITRINIFVNIINIRICCMYYHNKIIMDQWMDCILVTTWRERARILHLLVSVLQDRREARQQVLHLLLFKYKFYKVE